MKRGKDEKVKRKKDVRVEHLQKLYHEKSKSKTEQKRQKDLDGTYAIAETKPQRLFKKKQLNG